VKRRWPLAPASHWPVCDTLRAFGLLSEFALLDLLAERSTVASALMACAADFLHAFHCWCSVVFGLGVDQHCKVFIAPVLLFFREGGLILLGIVEVVCYQE
jgi:hypothetical protein